MKMILFQVSRSIFQGRYDDTALLAAMKKSQLTSKLSPVFPLFNGDVRGFINGGNDFCDGRRNGSKGSFSLPMISDHSVSNKEYTL